MNLASFVNASQTLADPIFHLVSFDFRQQVRLLIILSLWFSQTTVKPRLIKQIKEMDFNHEENLTSAGVSTRRVV